LSGRRRDSRVTPFPRTARVNEVLREVIADALERLADRDERLGLVTVTAVDTAPDLHRATVYVSSLPDEALAVLVAQRAELQRLIARQVRMKRTPHLEFEPDPAVARGWRVEEILRHLHRTGHDVAPGDDDPRGPDHEGDPGAADERP
jgi:ribosome-binding factor A